MSRSTDPGDYQSLPQPVAAMSKSFADGFQIDWHAHARDQLIYAVSGTMRVRTPAAAWIVPSDRAVYMPAGIPHALVMHGAVHMCTLYVSVGVLDGLPREPTAIAASDLLRALILALLDEPVGYGPGSRGDRLGGLALEEIARAAPVSLSIPMPADARLKRICEALMREPADARALDRWAEQVGASERTLARLFQAECQMSFAQWRQRVRFHHAIAALGRGRSVAEAARDVGYRSPSAFTAAFRRAFGMTPGGSHGIGAGRGLD
jgi:AraC-like DNA-binding protein